MRDEALKCYGGVVRLGWSGILMQAEAVKCYGGVTVWFGWGGLVSLCGMKH